MNVAVNEDRCRGHAVCWSLCDEVFAISDDGYATVLLPKVPRHHEAAVLDAERNCPERAITVSTDA